MSTHAQSKLTWERFTVWPKSLVPVSVSITPAIPHRTLAQFGVTGTQTILSYSQTTTNLQAQVDPASLDQGTQSSLDTLLQAAIALFNAGDTTDGARQLVAFVHHVCAQSSKLIDAALADALIADAQQIINAAG